MARIPCVYAVILEDRATCKRNAKQRQVRIALSPPENFGMYYQGRRAIPSLTFLRGLQSTEVETMHPEIEELANLLQRLSNFLVEVGEEGWAKWFAQDSWRVRLLDFYGVEHALLAFGGMGNINDLVIHPMNRHRVHEAEVEAANEKLRNLLSQVFTLAHKLKHEEVKARGG
jgi:hypothetical protein